ncbi:hypothetical protein [Sphingosinicella microcystinivorans]|uniref:hypothetical protein n=1 Tax=Sphingosinicella microcystinivorans TaxID=335406 RepID=UPI0022F3DE6E|nr:hypothetical protein [Sphingosinicella microcystinivorans]WBX85056.1 hypothetical protein PE061_03770 [Sphingosinicella microcystinivorans]
MLRSRSLLLSAIFAAALFPSSAEAQGAIAIDGKAAAPKPLGTIRTPTGEWPVARLDGVGRDRAYLFRYAAKPEWGSICITRAPDGGGMIDERAYAVASPWYTGTIRVLPGSMKCADNGEPVAPSMERLRQAVADKRVLPYSAAAFSGWPKTPSSTPRRLPGGIAQDYKPDRIYGRSSSWNSIGVVSGQGGEYSSSRGFLSGDDAQMIAAAVDGDSAMFTASAVRNRAQMLWSLSLPNLAIWSANHDTLRDPQLPLSGDLKYVNEGIAKTENYKNEGKWTAPADYPYLAELAAKAGTTYPHGRDEAHLINHGYAYWLATGDPRAAILQQATAAYALAAPYRGPVGGNYRAQFNYQRMTLNLFSAVWKARDVAQNASGPLLWEPARGKKMAADVIADWKTLIAQLDGTEPATRIEVTSVSAERRAMMSAFKAYDATVSFSDFMAQGYGPEVAYLWASAGEPALLRRLAEHFVIRARVGGTRGFDEPVESTLISMNGSATTLDGILAQFAARTDLPATNFNGSAPHTIQRAYWLLRMAKDAAARGWMSAVPGVDEAIAKIEAARAATTAWKYPDILAWKHAGVNFDVAAVRPRRPR